MLTRNVLLFARLLRQAGLTVSTDQQLVLVEALAHVDLRERRQVKATIRSVLATGRDESLVIDRLFDAFAGMAPEARDPLDLGRLLRKVARRRPQRLALEPAGDEDPTHETDAIDPLVRASAVERLRHTDFAELSDDERRAVVRWLLERPLRLRPRRTRRWRAERGGPRVDLRGTLRQALRRGGEPIEIARRRRRTKTRPLVALCDISGSMELYARVLLPFLYALRASAEQVEVFAFGTRLTRLTRALERRDPDAALAEAARRIVDWGGGTRIGESLRRFNRRWGPQVLRRGAVVLVLSDAWDRGDADLLARETARLARTCSRLIWLNPLLGSDGYAPTASGIQAVLPHCSDFLPVHNLASLDSLARVLRHLDP
ncbi:MAG: VWA domain-containing protein [Acidobacteriota bacterium]